MGNLTKFERQISLAIIKYARGVPKHEQDDLRQEIIMALFTAGIELNEKLAYDIARKRVMYIMRKSPPPMDDIDDPVTRKRYERQNIHFPDEERRLDSLLAAEKVELLPEPYRTIIAALFGIGVPEQTELELAARYNMSRYWIIRRKQYGLKLLRDIME